AGQSLGRRDAIGVYDTNTVTIKATKDAQVLLIEVPK
ncbi:MAG: Quercetinase C-terminal cupin domain, partial [Bacteroidota bacterium]